MLLDNFPVLNKVRQGDNKERDRWIEGETERETERKTETEIERESIKNYFRAITGRNN